MQAIERTLEKHDNAINGENGLRASISKLMVNDELMNLKIDALSKQLQTDIENINHKSKRHSQYIEEDRADIKQIKEQLATQKLRQETTKSFISFFCKYWWQILLILLVVFSMFNEENILHKLLG